MASPRRRSKSGNPEVRQALLDASRALLSNPSSGTPTSRAITDRAGANLGAITYYFGSKEQLLREAMVLLAQNLLGPVIDALRADDPPEVRLAGAVDTLQRLFAGRRNLTVGYTEALAAACGDAALASDLRRLREGAEAVLAEEIGAQVGRGLLPAWVAPLPMAQLIVAAVHGVVVTSASDPDFDPVPLGGQLVGLLLAARNGVDRHDPPST